MSQLVLETVQHSTLSDIDDVEQISQKDYDVLEEVRKVLVEHGYTDRFGMVLLHKHFDVKDDEMLIENTDVENRISTVHVEKASENQGNTIETMWKFQKDLEISSIRDCVLRCNFNSGHKLVHRPEKK